MAGHNKKSPRQYAPLTPITERDRRQAPSFRTLFYIFSGLVMMIFIAVLFAWAGYELGFRQAAAQAPPTPIVITSTIPVLQNTTGVRLVSPTAPVRPANTVTPASTPLQPFSSLRDTLLPTPTVPPTPHLQAVTLITQTLTPLASPVAPIPTVRPTPTPAIPAGQGLFIFYNPTGYDLIVDLTGPTSASALVPPDQQYEFLLEPGPYQYIVHTLTGEWLDTVVANFDLPPGQLVEKDYYSDYDWNR